MENLYFKEIPKELIMYPMKTGRESRIYITDNLDYVFKDLKGLEYPGIIEHYEYLKSIDSQYFYFPLQLVYENNKLRGYVMKRANGTTISKTPKNISFEEYCDAVRQVEKEIYSQTNQGLHIIDMNHENVIYNNKYKKLQVVDTDLYEQYDAYNMRDLLVENLKDSNLCFVSFVMNHRIMFNLPSEITEAFEYCKHGEMFTCQFLMKLKDYLENSTGIPIINIEDAQKKLLLHQKR